MTVTAVKIKEQNGWRKTLQHGCKICDMKWFQISDKAGWGGRIRTSVCRNQNPVPYHLATPQKASAGYLECRSPAIRPPAVHHQRVSAAARAARAFSAP